MGTLFLIVLVEWKLALDETWANIVQEILSGNSTVGATFPHGFSFGLILCYK